MALPAPIACAAFIDDLGTVALVWIVGQMWALASDYKSFFCCPAWVILNITVTCPAAREKVLALPRCLISRDYSPAVAALERLMYGGGTPGADRRADLAARVSGNEVAHELRPLLGYRCSLFRYPANGAALHGHASVMVTVT